MYNTLRYESAERESSRIVGALLAKCSYLQHKFHWSECKQQIESDNCIYFYLGYRKFVLNSLNVLVLISQPKSDWNYVGIESHLRTQPKGLNWANKVQDKKSVHL